MSEEIIHYGVKGMKWGRRKDGSNAATRVLDYQSKKNSENGVRRSLTRLDGVSGIDIIKAKGNIKKAVTNRNQKNSERIERVKSGEATVMDMLNTVGSVSLGDLVGGAGGVKAIASKVKKRSQK